MKVLLLGNGFDLYYKLPTRYIDFLNTIDYITNNVLTDIKTVGDIFGAEKLQKEDSYIAESYKNHTKTYHATPLSMEVIERIASTAENNMWYSYLWNSFNKDIGWIDFENQINTVISAFKDFLDDCPSPFNIHSHPKQPLSRHIIKQFDYFLKKDGNGVYSIKKEYMLEDPIGSNIYKINIEKWIGKLKSELDEFTEMLRLYLYYFIELPMRNIPSMQMENEWFARLEPDYVVTFNYTATFEQFCASARVAYIHGQVDSKIVLGVNPNEDDFVDTADTMFIDFKKYLQRITLGTDDEYHAILNQMDDGANDLILTVMGHSLDVTDQDIIRELFDCASDIAILYHNKNALRDYIAKLIVLYGKDGLDVMRKEKHLKFISLGNDLNEYVEAVTLLESVHMYL